MPLILLNPQLVMYKNDMVVCFNCKKNNFVKAKNFEEGFFKCSSCGRENKLFSTHYDERILLGLPQFGSIVSVNNPAERYSLKLGKNVIGVGEMADITIKRVTHNGKCFVSRRHCTLEVKFDKWKGQLNYILQDGAKDVESNQHNNSLNFTFFKNKKIEPQEAIYISNKEIFNLGGEDAFRLEHFAIPESMLQTYKISERINSEETTE
jgi:pSer/pThr/pTyr-binding forkhead associated (FHA) protein